MRIRFSGGAVQVTTPEGKIIYSEMLGEFLRDYGKPFTVTLIDGVGAYEYNDAVGSGMSAPQMTYFSNNGEANDPVTGAWPQGDLVLGAVPQIIAARNARLGLTKAKSSACVAILDAALKAQS